MTIYRDALERVYALIEKPENWVKGYLYADAHGQCVALPEEKVTACRYCLLGAIDVVCNEFRTTTHWRNWEDALGFEKNSLADFNDTHTHAEVLQLLKDAITRAPVRGGGE